LAAQYHVRKYCTLDLLVTVLVKSEILGPLDSLKFGSEVWVLKKREEQSLEAAQMKFLRHLLGITKLDKEKNQCIRQ